MCRRSELSSSSRRSAGDAPISAGGCIELEQASTPPGRARVQSCCMHEGADRRHSWSRAFFRSDAARRAAGSGGRVLSGARWCHEQANRLVKGRCAATQTHLRVRRRRVCLPVQRAHRGGV
jgi:hypothetical protein